MFSNNLLIDTQSFIWFVENNAKLSVSVRTFMEDGKHKLFISIANLWEIVIKSSLGKLPMQKSVIEMIKTLTEIGFNILQIKQEHLITLHSLEYIHRDPFDRIIISQAITDSMQLISSDDIFRKYPVNLVKA
jgi:PIN domain nuclease of toxin-antitoxin system